MGNVVCLDPVPGNNQPTRHTIGQDGLDIKKNLGWGLFKMTKYVELVGGCLKWQNMLSPVCST